MMTQDQTNAADDSEEEGPSPEYLIEVAEAEQGGRAITLVIAARRCYLDQQADVEPPTHSSNPKVFIKRIVDHCSAAEDYLSPDTPLKDAIFRVMLSEGNVPTTPETISEVLSEKWAMTAYPRDISPKVIQRLLDNSEAYGIFKISEPEPEEPEEEEALEIVDEVAVGETADLEDEGEGETVAESEETENAEEQ